MSVSTDPKKIEELLTRRVADAVVLDSLRKKLESGKVLRIKFGADPTSPDLQDRKSTRLNSSHIQKSRMPSSA